MDAEPGRCRRTDGKKWRCGKEVIPDQKYCERHMHRGRGRSRKLVEAPEIPLESAPANLQQATPSLKSSSNNSTGKAPTISSISSISGNENRIYAKKELTVVTATATATTTTATPTTNGINNESNKNVYPSKDTIRSTTTTGLWGASSDKINKCTMDSNNSVGKAPTTSPICCISGSENKIYAKQDSTVAVATVTTTTAATPTATRMDKESDKNIYHGKDTTRSMTTTGLLRAGSEKINICTSNSKCIDGKDAGYKHLNNINIRQSKNDRHAGYAGSSVASQLGFSPDSVLQVVRHSSSCLNYRNDVETELQRCRRTDGKKWRCGADVLPDQKYCGRHLHRGAKKFVVGEPVKVTSAPLPPGIFRATPVAIPKNKSCCIDLNTNLSLSVEASPQLTAKKEKNHTSCSSDSDADTISDDNVSVSHLLNLSP